MNILRYEEYLYGCRFCPMCKPFGEVSNVTKDESHSTRIRGMLLWQVVSGKAKWNENIAKIVYESSLNSVNKEWCISHYPVPDYILAARADLVEAGIAPTSVKDYSIPTFSDFAESLARFDNSLGEIMFYPGDAIAANDPGAAKAALELISAAGHSIRLPEKLIDSGALAFCLGRKDLALSQAKNVVSSLSGVSTVIVDGPLSMWALTKVYPQLGVSLPGKVQVCQLYDWLLSLHEQNKLVLESKKLKVFMLGSEFTRLIDGSYSAYRSLLSKVSGLQIIEPFDGLELSHSSGASGGLHLVAPELSQAVSQQRISEALHAGADCIVCDSALDASHIRITAGSQIKVSAAVEVMSTK